MPVILAMIGFSLGWALLVRFKPKWLGFDGKANGKAYLVCLIPLAVAFFSTWQDSGTSLDYPEAFDLHDNVLFIKGIHEYQNEDPDTRTKTRVRRDVIIMIDKQGNELARFNAGSAKVHNNKIFMDGLETYSMADLKTGEVLEVFSENDIKEQAAKFASEKIFTFEYTGGASFNIRTVRDNSFTYDALLNAINTNDGHILFERRDSAPITYSGKTSLFQPQLMGAAKNGSIILLSYDDLEKNAFIISAVEPNGNIIWSKHDNEISPSLSRKKFSSQHCDANTIIDEQNIYFVNQRYLVCLSSSTGDLKWMVEL